MEQRIQLPINLRIPQELADEQITRGNALSGTFMSNDVTQYSVCIALLVQLMDGVAFRQYPFNQNSAINACEISV